MAANDISIDRFQEAKPIPLKGLVMRIELGLSEGAMKKGLDESIVEEIESAMENRDLIWYHVNVKEWEKFCFELIQKLVFNNNEEYIYIQRRRTNRLSNS